MPTWGFYITLAFTAVSGLFAAGGLAFRCGQILQRLEGVGAKVDELKELLGKLAKDHQALERRVQFLETRVLGDARQLRLD